MMGNCGIQLFTVRQALAEDFKGTLKEVAALGFDGVEFSGYYADLEAEELSDYLASLKLRVSGTMFSRDQLLDPKSGVYEYAKKLDSPAVTCGLVRDDVPRLDKATKEINTIAQYAFDHGVKLSLHNHWWEFAKFGDTCGMEILLSATDPEKVFLEPDVCWLTRAGINVTEYIGKYAPRVIQLHLKDIEVPDKPETLTELGSGVVDLQGAIAAACNTPCQWFIYEQDSTRKTPMESSALSLKWMRQFVR
ncbi:MAG: sugar phosphate isomerase/epimerase [Victivallaceae bacterium]|nr:sugar phosphate isomerase/epimerase [Victivallaceae bacterium]